MSEEINHDRRHFLARRPWPLPPNSPCWARRQAQSSGGRLPAPPVSGPGTNASLGALKQVDAGVLNVGYAEAGPADGPVVILLHGWPYDIHTFVDVAPLLASAGYRVIVPYLRGYGTTRFLSERHVPQRPASRRSRSTPSP